MTFGINPNVIFLFFATGNLTTMATGN